MNSMLETRLIVHGSKDYALEIALRDEVLRKPLGLEISVSDLEKEVNDIHLGAFRDGCLLGCLMLVRVTNEITKMRQVAVATDARGLGVGQALVRASEKIARERGYRVIELSARDTAISFYEKLGYAGKGQLFEEVTIPHLMMSKNL